MKKRLISIALIMILVLSTYSVALADGNTSVNATRNSLKSVGNVVYTDGENRVEIHSDDLYMLADKMDSFKECVADQLAQNHTYFSKGSNGTSTVTDSDIKVVHTQPSNDDAVDPVSLDFDTIMEGIAASQSIPSDITEYGYADGTILYKTESGELTTDGTLENVQQIDISAATPENLSAGSAAWVNGELVLGTGADNDAYYQLGKRHCNVHYIRLDCYAGRSNSYHVDESEGTVIAALSRDVAPNAVVGISYHLLMNGFNIRRSSLSGLYVSIDTSNNISVTNSGAYNSYSEIYYITMN